MKVLVTGGIGFIGTTTCHYLLKKNHQVIALDNFKRPGVKYNLNSFLNKRKKTNSFVEHFSFVEADVRDSFALNKIKNIDAIIHLAANPGIPKSIEDPIYDFETNTRGTLNILQLARTIGKIPVIFASTNKVYPETVNNIKLKTVDRHYEAIDMPNGLSETFPMDGVGSAHSPYGCSKAAADLYCQEYFHTYNVNVIINRMSAIYGPFQRGLEEQGWLVWFMIRKVKEKVLTIFGNGLQTRDCLYGEDLAKLYETQITHPKIFAGKIFNIGGGIKNTISLLEFVDYLDKHYKQYKKLKLVFDKERIADQKYCVCDISKILATKMWQPETDLKKGIEKTIKWVIDNRDELA